MEPVGRARPAMWMALALGFGATLALWAYAGYYFTQRMADLQRESAVVNQRFTHSQALLASVRTEVLLGSLQARDGLLDVGDPTVSRRRVEETYAAIDRTLREYEAVTSSAERDRLTGLHAEILALRGALLQILDTDPSEASLLLGRTIPRRVSVLRLSAEIQALDRAAFAEQQQTLAGIYATMQRRVWETLSLALVATIGIALFATSYVGRLERDLHAQRLKELQTTADLQRLSTKLVSAQEEERRTIARELHDEVGQALMALKVELSLVERRLETAIGQPRILADAHAVADSALSTVRDLSRLLHPAILDDLGLPAAVDWYLTGFSRRYGIGAELLQTGMHGRLPSEVEAAAYRIVQEALTNVARHSGATLAIVYLRLESNAVHVVVEDDGGGFESGAAREGLGLIGMRERAAGLGGTFHVDSTPGRGTRVHVALPLSPGVEPDAAEMEPAAAALARQDAVSG